MNADTYFEAWLEQHTGLAHPDELRQRDWTTAQVFLRDRLHTAFRAGWDSYKGRQVGGWVPPKCNTPDPVALRMQVQAELRQAKAQLRALEIAHNSLRQDYERMKDGGPCSQ